MADLVFLVVGLFLLWRSERRPIDLSVFRSWFKMWAPKPSSASDGPALAIQRESTADRLSRRWRLFNLHFPTILDDYVLRDFTVYLD